MIHFQILVEKIMKSTFWFSACWCFVFLSIVALWSFVAYIVADCNYNGVEDCT